VIYNLNSIVKIRVRPHTHTHTHVELWNLMFLYRCCGWCFMDNWSLFRNFETVCI